MSDKVQGEIIADVQDFGNRTANPHTQIDDSSTSAEAKSAKRARSVWSALGSLGRAVCEHFTFSDLHKSLRLPPRTPARQRDLFPLPLISLSGIRDRLGIAGDIVIDACHYLEGVVVGLNWMYGIRVCGVSVGNLTEAQRTAHCVILAAAELLFERMVDGVDDRLSNGWHAFEQKGEAPRLDLIASAVAVPECAATCSPSSLINGPLGSAIQDVDCVFPRPPPGLNHFPGFYSGDRKEYIHLTVRQLKAGLLRLAVTCSGGASVFPVGKSGGKQRVVWNGTRISQAAARPPAPPHLADPACFGMLDLEAGAQLRVTKRDCKTWFDQLAVHPDIGNFFGRPRVTRSELVQAGLSVAEIDALGGSADVDSYIPCSNVWPMGFSWSSCVAQSTLLGVCALAGLASDRILASDLPLPSDLSLAFAVATDDLMIFSVGPATVTVAAAEEVERVMTLNGIIKNPEKDVNGVLSTTCVGVDLIDGRYWTPPSERLWRHLDAVVDLSKHGVGSRGGVAGFLGSAQWFDLLRRLRLSVFDHVYGFSSGSLAKDWTQMTVPTEVTGELLLDTAFALFGCVDMNLPFLPLIAATDASTEYGHGGVVSQASIEEVRRVARMACKLGGHVCMEDGPALSHELLARLGPRHDLKLELGNFDVIFTVRVETPGHINIEEGVALIRYLKWVLRSSSRFRHRVVLLIDSKVVLGAVAKGRSSSKPLNTLVRRAAALCFAGGLVLHCVFISTKHNPADWPSRGEASSWPAALRQRAFRRCVNLTCPGCGLHPSKHPQHLPRRLRGQPGSKYNCCAGPAGGFAYDYDIDKWEPYHVWFARYADAMDKLAVHPLGRWKALAAGDGN